MKDVMKALSESDDSGIGVDGGGGGGVAGVLGEGKGAGVDCSTTAPPRDQIPFGPAQCPKRKLNYLQGYLIHPKNYYTTMSRVKNHRVRSRLIQTRGSCQAVASRKRRKACKF